MIPWGDLFNGPPAHLVPAPRQHDDSDGGPLEPTPRLRVRRWEERFIEKHGKEAWLAKRRAAREKNPEPGRRYAREYKERFIATYGKEAWLEKTREYKRRWKEKRNATSTG